MLGFLLRRLLQAVPVLLTVGLVSFAMFAFVGDPLQIMLGQEDMDVSKRLEIAERLGLHQPFYVQYARYILSAMSGQFGVSYRVSVPVTELIGKAFPATFELVSIGMLLALVFGVAAGVFAAVRRRSKLAGALMFVSLIGYSAPTFVIGIFLVLVFSVSLGWLPSFGRGEVVDLGFWTTGLLTWSGLKALVLPSITIALFQMAMIMRLVRTEMLGVLRANYIRFARARGIRERTINFRHALKNTLVPVITIVGIQFGSAISFAIVTESVFQWPGMGQLLVQSIRVADIPVMSAYLMLVALLFVFINLVVDLLYLAVDPRMRKHLGSPR